MTLERMSISIDRQYAEEIRKLVDDGAYRNISAAFQEAATILIEQQAEKAAWWKETIRRCDEAEHHPERMIPHDAFFAGVHADIAELRKRTPRK